MATRGHVKREPWPDVVFGSRMGAFVMGGPCRAVATLPAPERLCHHGVLRCPAVTMDPLNLTESTRSSAWDLPHQGVRAG
jgi:hypothetical protein